MFTSIKRTPIKRPSLKYDRGKMDPEPPEPENFGTIDQLGLRAQVYARSIVPATVNETESLGLMVARSVFDAHDYITCEIHCNDLLEQRDIQPATKAAVYLLIGTIRGTRAGPLYLRRASTLYQELLVNNSRDQELKDLLRITRGLEVEAEEEWYSSEQKKKEAMRLREQWLKYEFGME